MIRVEITGPPSGTGFVPYRIESWAYGRPQFVGVSPRPLLDACRQLKQAGLMDDTVVGLFESGGDQWQMRTTVGYGSRHAGPYREFPGGPIKYTPDGPPPARPEPALPPAPPSPPPDDLPEYDSNDDLPEEPPPPPPDDLPEYDPSDDLPARSEEPPPPRHTPREPPDDTDRGPSEPKKRHQSHHPRKPKASAGRRGSR